jgi:predicted nucleic acid-binding protein
MDVVRGALTPPQWLDSPDHQVARFKRSRSGSIQAITKWLDSSDHHPSWVARFIRLRNGSIGAVTDTQALESAGPLKSGAGASKRLANIQRDAASVIGAYSRLVDIVQSRRLAQPICRDPDDDHVIACAIAANADLIVTGDADLHDLGRNEAIRILSASGLSLIVGGEIIIQGRALHRIRPVILIPAFG